jgi:PAS domain-containing protein
VPTANETDRLLHELQVHRIELETQNEEMTRSHAALEKTCERYRAVLAAAPLGYLALDVTGRICDVNPLGARLLGLQAAELIDRHLQAFLRVADADHFHIRLRECLSTAIPQTLSVAMAQEDRPAPLRLQIVANANDDGAGPRAWVFMLEISQLVDDCVAHGGGTPRSGVLPPLAKEE